MTNVRHYHGVLVVLHWLLAVMIGVALIMGSTVLEHMPNSDPGKMDALKGHMVVGGLIGVLMLVRWVTRLSTQHPPKASTGMAWADRLAPWAHVALYAGVAVMVASGVGMALAFDLPAVVFQGQGSLPEDFHSVTPRLVHGLVAKLLMLTIVAHVLAALYHQWVRKDGLMSRMAWGPRR